MPFVTPWGQNAEDELDFHVAQMACLAECIGKVYDKHGETPESVDDAAEHSSNQRWCSCSLCEVVNNSGQNKKYCILWKQDPQATCEIAASFPLARRAEEHFASPVTGGDLRKQWTQFSGKIHKKYKKASQRPQ